jgi:hypothetical protein
LYAWQVELAARAEPGMLIISANPTNSVTRRRLIASPQGQIIIKGAQLDPSLPSR